MRLLFVLLALAGCAAQQPAVQAVDTRAPTCTGKACEAMWLDAQAALEGITGMRLRLVTDNRIETFGPTKYHALAGMVTKYPVGDGHELRARFECYRSKACERNLPNTLNTFNRRVGRQ